MSDDGLWQEFGRPLHNETVIPGGRGFEIWRDEKSKLTAVLRLRWSTIDAVWVKAEDWTEMRELLTKYPVFAWDDAKESKPNTGSKGVLNPVKGPD